MSDLAIERRSTLTCPACGAFTAETMPTAACQYFADCPACGAAIRRLLVASRCSHFCPQCQRRS